MEQCAPSMPLGWGRKSSWTKVKASWRFRTEFKQFLLFLQRFIILWAFTSLVVEIHYYYFRARLKSIAARAKRPFAWVLCSIESCFHYEFTVAFLSIIGFLPSHKIVACLRTSHLFIRRDIGFQLCARFKHVLSAFASTPEQFGSLGYDAWNCIKLNFLRRNSRFLRWFLRLVMFMFCLIFLLFCFAVGLVTCLAIGSPVDCEEHLLLLRFHAN